jgi:hypothetical protein
LHTAEFIIIGVIALAVVVALLVHFGWSISTQHRDHGAAVSGSLPQRHIWSRRSPRPDAGPVNAEAIPGEQIRGQQHSDVSAGIPRERS